MARCRVCVSGNFFNVLPVNCSNEALHASEGKHSRIRGAFSFLTFISRLVHLLLLVKADLAGAHVDEEEQTADDRQDLEEVVLGEVLVGVVLVEL